jgi:hypothetical protein
MAIRGFSGERVQDEGGHFPEADRERFLRLVA